MPLKFKKLPLHSKKNVKNKSADLNHIIKFVND